jgi:hypothetical protein
MAKYSLPSSISKSASVRFILVFFRRWTAEIGKTVEPNSEGPDDIDLTSDIAGVDAQEGSAEEGVEIQSGKTCRWSEVMVNIHRMHDAEGSA